MSTLDAETILSDKQDLAKAVGSYLSDKSYDLGATGSDVNGNTPISDPGRSHVPIHVQVTETFASAGAATMKVDLVMADNDALTSNLVVLQSTDTIALATLVAGYQFRLGPSLPPGVLKRYFGFRYTVGTATMTAGKITAAVLMDRPSSLSL